MDNGQTYYEILQVSRDATLEVIKSAFRTIMSKLKKHPDLGGDVSEAIRINRAYEVLSNSSERAVYDTFLSKLKKEDVVKSEEQNFSERRRTCRDVSDAAVSFCFKHDSFWHSARARDVSALGMRIQAHVPMRTGEALVIIMPNIATPAIHATVRWSRMFHPSIFERVYEAGIEFSEKLENLEQRISI